MGVALGFGQGCVQRLLELCLYRGGVGSLLAGGKVEHQQVLLHLHRARGRQLHDIAQLGGWRILSKRGTSASNQNASSYQFSSNFHHKGVLDIGARPGAGPCGAPP